MSTQLEQTPTYIAGEWITSDEKINVLDPASDNVIGSVPKLGETHAIAALDAALRGAQEWAATKLLTRGQVLFSAARLLRERSDKLAELIVRENGKTIAEATGEVEKSAQFFEYYGGMARDPYGYLLADARPGARAEVRYEPIGSVLVITPWNDPLLTPARKIAPALFTGNSVIFKPASETPLVALGLTRVLLEAGLPAEVLSTITGRGREIVDPLLERAGGLSAVSFTGSTEAGLQIQAKLAGANVRVQTEMGGKNAVVVMADADLDLAVDTVIAGAFGQSGQRCTATSRILVSASIKDEFSSRLAKAVTQLRVGSGLDGATQVGPLVSRSQRDTVLEFVKRARQGGGVVRAEASVSEELLTSNGNYVAPVLIDVTANSELWTDEVFGPVLAMRSFETLDEAIDEVNASRYGLSAAIFTESLNSATAFTDRVHTGQVSVNLPTTGWDIHHPFGGFKDSGSGYKEQGTETLRFYTRVKTVAIRTS